jgi:CHAT domain-containing protein/Tfp pilus assembly protein PilF
MSGSALARWCCPCLALGAAWALAQALLVAGPPALRPEQQERLRQRQCLQAEANERKEAGRLAEAVAAADKALALARQVFGDVHDEVASSLEALADLHLRRAEFIGARRARREALAIRIKLHGEKDWRSTDARLALADVDLWEKLNDKQRQRLVLAERLEQQLMQLTNQGRYDEALPMAKQVVASRTELLGEQHWLTTRALWNLGWVYRLKGDFARAEAPCRQAVAIRRQLLGEDHPLYGRALNNLGWWHVGRKEYEKAEELFRQAVAIHRQANGEDSFDYRNSVTNLVLLYGRMAGKYTAAEDFARAGAVQRRVVDLQSRLWGKEHWHVTDARLVLADIERLGRMTAEQRRRLAEAERLEAQVLRLRNQGRSREAVQPARQVVEIRREVLGKKHRAYASSLNNLAGVHVELAEYSKAEPLYVRVVEIEKQVLGERHPDYAVGLNNLALLYCYMAEYAKAERLYQNALEIHRQARGERDPTYITALSNLASLLTNQGEYARAEPLLQQAVKVRRQVLGERHADYALSLNNLAAVYTARGEYVRAEPLHREALRIKQQVLGERHPEVALNLNNLAYVYHCVGEYAKAESLYLKALEIRRQALGEKHPEYANGLSNLAAVYISTGEYARAKPLVSQALEIRRQALGEKHPDYALSLNNLAGLYEEMGEYALAKPLYEQAVGIYGRALGRRHPTYATSLDNLARLHDRMGDSDQAEALYHESLQIRKQALGEKHPDYAHGLNNLATLYDATRRYARAEPLLREAADIKKQALGERHPDYATALNNLAEVYRSMGRDAQARPLLESALEIRRQALGDRNPYYASSLNNLAALYRDMAQYGQAKRLLQRAVAIYRDALGEHHPEYAIGLNNLAGLDWLEAIQLRLLPPSAPLPNLAARCDAGLDCSRAEGLLRQAVDVARGNLELAATVQSQRQQLAMLQQQRWLLDLYLSLAPEAGSDAAAQYAPVLAWKGAVGRRQRYQRLARRQPQLAGDFAELDRVAAQLAALALTAPAGTDAQTRHRQIEELTGRKERLESELGRRSAAFRKEKEQRQLQPAQLQAALPADAALLDFLEYEHRSPVPGLRGRWPRERRLVAFVVRRDALLRVELGPSRAIGEALQRWREALQRRFVTEGDARLGAEVRRLVWQPLQAHLKGARLVLVSPDGPLDRLPLAALPGRRKDGYLLEDVALTVVPVPQLLPELLASRAGPAKGEPSLLVVGDVRYDAAPGGEAVADNRAAPRGGGLAHWQPLEGTRAEVAAIRDSFQRRYRRATVTDLREDEATEAAVRSEAPAHRYVHFATHGFFAPKELRSALAEASRGGKPETGDLFGSQGMAGFHPGLLSGLVLAGANRPADPARDDGILTALEVEALDLSGVELATLSACETGLGEEAGGEGLLGLQRAFQLAGARAVVASLWQVDDKATRELMVRFYENLWKRNMSRLEALRQAQLWMLMEGAARGMVDVRVPRERLPVEDGRVAPYFWAAFTLSGDWR